MSVEDLWHRLSEFQDEWSRENKGYWESLSLAHTSNIQPDFLAFALHQPLLIMASDSLGLCLLLYLSCLFSLPYFQLRSWLYPSQTLMINLLPD